MELTYKILYKNNVFHPNQEKLKNEVYYKCRLIYIYVVYNYFFINLNTDDYVILAVNTTYSRN